jgi:hypothetical protein
MQHLLNFNTTNWSENNASSHDELDGNCLENSVRSRRRLWSSIPIFSKIRWRVGVRPLPLIPDPERNNFFTTLAAGLRSPRRVRRAEWGAAFQNGHGPPENGPTRFAKDSMIGTLCESSSVQSKQDSGISVMSVVTLPRRHFKTRVVFH